ncbi:glycosyltransferase [Hominibacterium faecale]|uniref:glycosyltransferase n=1 Tax=Hominibacterium faecale TaxID=2839743 RepID=UPI0022B298C8|nr:glycosyltransferase [Hominibacterium faecale]
MRCIFHVPMTISDQPKSGSGIRPLKMLQAFRDIGYDVSVVMGNGKERKKAIQNIKKEIRKGEKFDFLYSESSTMPTLLTEKNHIPRYPLLDFQFFLYCKNNGIKIGLFYRDIYWKFPVYKKTVAAHKRLLSIPLYKYDLEKYKKLLDICYVPSLDFSTYLNKELNYHVLPPGGTFDLDFLRERKLRVSGYREERTNELNIFYVGGIAGLHDITQFCSVVLSDPRLHLTICCKMEDWKLHHSQYEKFLCDRIKVIHKSGSELEEYFLDADIAGLYYKNEIYRDFAMPVKLFEYVCYGVPVIATKGTVAQEFVTQNDVGWAVNYNEEDLSGLFVHLCDNYGEVVQKMQNCISCAKDNSWEARAKQVSDDLKQLSIK